MRKTYIDVIFVNLLLFWGVLSFSDVSDDGFHESLLPEWIRVVASFFRWGLFFIISLLATFRFHFLRRNITSNQLCFTIFYGILMILSLRNEEFLRYAIMTISCIFIPLVVAHAVKTNGFDFVLKTLWITSAALVILSAFVSITKTGGLSLGRYTGITLNPNSWVGINIFFCLIFLCALVNKTLDFPLRKLIFPFFLCFSILTQLLAGSRNGFLAIILLFGIFCGMTKKFKYLLLALTIGAGSLVLFNEMGSDVTQRIFDLKTATEDSGRSVIWEAALQAVSKHPLTGCGTDSRAIETGTDNIHNMFVALILMCGYGLGPLLCFLFLLGAALPFLSARKAICPEHKVVYYVVCSYPPILAMMSFGEDAPLGVGSPWFIYLIITLGLIAGLREESRERQLRPQKFRISY